MNESQYNYLKRAYIAVINCPENLIPYGDKVEEFVIDQKDIDEFLDEGDGNETEEDAIKYFMEEYVNEWEQRFCSVKFHTMEEYFKKTGKIPSISFRRRSD